MSHLEKRANTFYAVLTVPPDVRPTIGKLRYVKSLQTPKRAEALLRAAIVVAQWKAEIAKARGTARQDPKADFWGQLRQQYIATQDEGTQLAIEGAARAAAAKVTDPAEGSLLYRIAIGVAPERVPLGPLVAEWKGSLTKRVQKSIDQAHRDVSRMADHFKHLDALTHAAAAQAIKAWLDQLRGAGTTASTFERLGTHCRSFWAYLQHSGAVGLVDPDPFVGPFKLAQKMAVRNKVDRQGFEPQQLADLYGAALAKGDQPLADLIALGAYTGARIEELCQLTTVTARGGVLRMGTKTDASERETPVHPQVAPLVARLMKDSTDGFLIPSAADNQYSNRSGPLSQRFGHLKTAYGLDKRYTFHGCRHTVVTLLHQAEVSSPVIADIVGHERGSFTLDKYGKGSSHQQKAEALALVKYPAPLSML